MDNVDIDTTNQVQRRGSFERGSLTTKSVFMGEGG